MSRWLPWRWLARHRHGNGHHAADAEREASAKLRGVKDRQAEVQQAIDAFSRSVERAMRGAKS